MRFAHSQEAYRQIASIKGINKFTYTYEFPNTLFLATVAWNSFR